MKNKILNEKVWLIIVLIAIGASFSFANQYVAGELEMHWAITGMIVTNYNLLMFFMLALAGAGIVWIIYRYAKRSKLFVSIISVLCLSLAMAMSQIFMYLIPIVVAIAIAILLVKERRKKNVSISDGK
jgi:hypothetical protein